MVNWSEIEKIMYESVRGRPPADLDLLYKAREENPELYKELSDRIRKEAQEELMRF